MLIDKILSWSLLKKYPYLDENAILGLTSQIMMIKVSDNNQICGDLWLLL